MELINKIFDAGIVGAGGAGFPAHIKLNCKVEFLLINAAECEPLLNTDKYIMNHFAVEIVEAVKAVSEMVCAKETFIAVKKVNEKEIAALQAAIDKKGADIKIFPLDNYYPAGDEQMIVFDITGRTVPPGGIPLQVGAAVSNVATMLTIYDAISGSPVTHKFLTVTGEVKKPSVLKVPIGTPFNECVEACGGVLIKGYKVINGGPMMGKVFDSLDDLFVTKTTSGIIIIKDSDNSITWTKALSVRQILNRAKSACIQCKFCTELCPRNLIGHSIHPNKIMRYMSSMDFNKGLLDADAEILKEALICCECGVCETYACPMGLSPRQVNVFVKGKLAGKKYAAGTDTFEASKERAFRKIMPSRIMSRMGLRGLYANKADQFKELTCTAVNIPLKQHIGIPAKPCVGLGDSVSCAQVIAVGEFDKVSANIHASISGKVTKLGDSIEIRA